MGTVVTMPEEIGIRPSELLKISALPSETENAPRQLTSSANEVVRAVVSVLDDMITAALGARTSQEFVAVRTNVFPRYFSAMAALGSLIRVTVSKHAITRLLNESLCELEADFRELGAAAFGAELRDRGLFTVWTLRQISELAEQMQKIEGASDDETARKFAIYALWSRFHIDCLVKAMRAGMPIFPEVSEDIVDGLRAAVDAYAWIKQAVNDHAGISEPDMPPVPWDAEDEALLSDSMRDLKNL